MCDPDLKLASRYRFEPCAQNLCQRLWLGVVVERRVERRQNCVGAKSQLSRVAATAPSARVHRARAELATFEPLTDAARLFSASFAQIALSAAIAQLEVSGVANAGNGCRMPDQHHTGPGEQQRRNIWRTLSVR